MSRWQLQSSQLNGSAKQHHSVTAEPRPDSCLIAVVRRIVIFTLSLSGKQCIGIAETQRPPGAVSSNRARPLPGKARDRSSFVASAWLDKPSKRYFRYFWPKIKNCLTNRLPVVNLWIVEDILVVRSTAVSPIVVLFSARGFTQGFPFRSVWISPFRSGKGKVIS